MDKWIMVGGYFISLNHVVYVQALGGGDIFIMMDQGSVGLSGDDAASFMRDFQTFLGVGISDDAVFTNEQGEPPF